MTVFFTSDLHLGHKAMAWYRDCGAWPTAEQRTLITPAMVAAHDDHLARIWDLTVRRDDVVWVLGDLTANNKTLPDALRWIDRRPGTKHLILGNHDPAHPMYRDSYLWQHRYFPAFSSVQSMARRRIGGQQVLLSHFPYDGDGLGKEDRATQYRLRNEGLPLLHGHVHTHTRVAHADEFGDLESDRRFTRDRKSVV